MNITTVPFDNWIEIGPDGKATGRLSVQANLFMQQLIGQLQTNLSDGGGYVIPAQPADYIANNLANTNRKWTLIGDSTNNVLKINLNGVIKTIQVA